MQPLNLEGGSRTLCEVNVVSQGYNSISETNDAEGTHPCLLARNIRFGLWMQQCLETSQYLQLFQGLCLRKFCLSCTVACTFVWPYVHSAVITWSVVSLWCCPSVLIKQALEVVWLPAHICKELLVHFNTGNSAPRLFIFVPHHLLDKSKEDAVCLRVTKAQSLASGTPDLGRPFSTMLPKMQAFSRMRIIWSPHKLGLPNDALIDTPCVSTTVVEVNRNLQA